MKTWTPKKTRPSAASEGFIVVAVLWILGALATLTSIYATYVIDTAATFSVHDDHLRAEGLVSAAVELTAYRLSAPPQTRPTQGRFAFRLGASDVVVEFRSEASRIDLNTAPKDLIAGLFVVLGAGRDDADGYAERILGWRTTPSKNQDQEASAYLSAGLKYAPRGAKFPHVNELSLVLGLPTNLVERALPFLTVYSASPKINILEAAPEVVAALPGMTRDVLNTVLAQRTAPGNGQALLALLGRGQGFATIEGSKASRVKTQITLENGRQISSEVVILVSDEANQPFFVLSYHDELDEPQNDGGRTVLR